MFHHRLIESSGRAKDLRSNKGNEHLSKPFPVSQQIFPTRTSNSKFWNDSLARLCASQNILAAHFANALNISSTSSDELWSSTSTYPDNLIAPMMITTTITSTGNENNQKSHFVSITRAKLFGKHSKATPVTTAKTATKSPRGGSVQSPISQCSK